MDIASELSREEHFCLEKARFSYVPCLVLGLLLTYVLQIRGYGHTEESICHEPGHAHREWSQVQFQIWLVWWYFLMP